VTPFHEGTRKAAAAILVGMVAWLGGIAGRAAAQPVATAEFLVPTLGSLPTGIAAGPDGNVWFTEQAGNRIGRITPGGVITEFLVVTAGSAPTGITQGPDGNLWFTQRSIDRIGRITPSGVVTEFLLPTPGAAPTGITAGPDGNLWFTEQAANQIGRITPGGVVTEFLLPTPGNAPTGITAGPDGNLWFTEQAANRIGRITPAGVVTEFFVVSPESSPTGITQGPDGNLWFTQQSANRIGRITPAGVVTEFLILTPNSAPAGITTGPDGALWFTENAVNQLGRITVGGVVTELGLPTANSGPLGITAGPDGRIWLTEATANRIARVTITLTITVVRDGTGSGSVSSNPGGILCPTACTASFDSGTIVTLSATPQGGSVFAGWTDRGCAGTGTCTIVLVANVTVTASFNLASVFADVPPGHFARPFIEALFAAGVVSGCATSPLRYCPTDPVPREQMAVFLLKASEGASFVPPPCTTPPFGDVPCASPFAVWIQELAARGITVGCGGGNYCPASLVSRQEMAVFILETLGVTPPPCTSSPFTDVPCTDPFAPWIVELFNRGITAGCTPTTYCPASPVTRDQMAVFLVRAFDIPLP
jgi:streptogramin lyase